MPCCQQSPVLYMPFNLPAHPCFSLCEMAIEIEQNVSGFDLCNHSEGVKIDKRKVGDTGVAGVACIPLPTPATETASPMPI